MIQPIPDQYKRLRAAGFKCMTNGCISALELRMRLGVQWHAFLVFMAGQTVCDDGVYVGDVETFLAGLPPQDRERMIDNART